MTLADQTTPTAEWDDSGRVSIAITCHCGESFPLSRIDDARAHVEGHEPVDEPS